MLADKGSPPQAGGTPTASGAGIQVPVRRQRGGRELDEATLGWNAYINAHRAPVERSISVLKVRWRALKHVTLDPARIGAMAAAALVLTRTEKGY